MTPLTLAALDLNAAAVVSFLTVIAFIATAATVVGYGLQRGRIGRLESSNDGLRAEVADWQRRHDTLKSDLAEAVAKAGAQREELIDLKASVTTMTSVMHGLEDGPVRHLDDKVAHAIGLLEAHNAETMHRFDGLRDIGLDLLSLAEDRRARVRRAAPTDGGDGATDAG